MIKKLPYSGKDMLSAFILSVTLLVPPTGILNAASFSGLGDLSGGIFYSSASDVSADGTTVVGASQSSDGLEAFRWTLSSGMLGLGDLSGGSVHSTAWAVSADGSTIVGMATVEDNFAGHKAFKWTESSGMISLGDLSGGSARSQAMGVSADGSKIVGYSQPSVVSNPTAFTWTEGGGMLPISGANVAKGISANGGFITGSSISSGNISAFRYTSESGVVKLGAYSDSLGISADGSTIVGIGNFGSGNEAFRYTLSDGKQGLGDLPGGAFDSSALDASFGGSIIVGRATAANGTANGYEAFIWTEATGMLSVKSVLALNGVHGFEGWQLVDATGISDDGHVIVGSGINPGGNTEAWIARIDFIPEPSAILLILTVGLPFLVMKHIRRHALKQKRSHLC